MPSTLCALRSGGSAARPVPARCSRCRSTRCSPRSSRRCARTPRSCSRRRRARARRRGSRARCSTPGLAQDGEIVVLEPRRLATRMAARRVADELGESPGGTVGYQVRFEDVTGPRTRVRFVTEGILGRRLLASPKPRRRRRGRARRVPRAAPAGRRGARAGRAPASHEPARPARRRDERDARDRAARRLPRRARPSRRGPALRGGDRAPAGPRRSPHRVAGRVGRADAWSPRASTATSSSSCRAPAEIRRAREACAKIAAEADLLLVPLHGDLSPQEQDAAVRPGSRRKVILSTNVAESSVTIEGVVAVVDAGLARVASQAPWSGFPRLRVEKISRASATQRAGRAGRTRPGPLPAPLHARRLRRRARSTTRPRSGASTSRRPGSSSPRMGAADVPVARGSPGGARARGVRSSCGASARWTPAAVTATGRAMLRFAVHPRAARVVVEGERRGVAGGRVHRRGHPRRGRHPGLEPRAVRRRTRATIGRRRGPISWPSSISSARRRTRGSRRARCARPGWTRARRTPWPARRRSSRARARAEGASASKERPRRPRARCASPSSRGTRIAWPSASGRDREASRSREAARRSSPRPASCATPSGSWRSTPRSGRAPPGPEDPGSSRGARRGRRASRERDRARVAPRPVPGRHRRGARRHLGRRAPSACSRARR